MKLSLKRAVARGVELPFSLSVCVVGAGRSVPVSQATMTQCIDCVVVITLMLMLMTYL